MKSTVQNFKQFKNLATAAVAVLFLQGAVWAQTQKGSDINGTSSEWFGWSVSMGDANTFAASCPGNSGVGTYAGAVRVYAFNGATWAQKGPDITNPQGSAGSLFQFGSAVSMPDANTVGIGSRVGFGGNGVATGHAIVYSWNGSSWVQKGQEILGDVNGDNFGFSMCMPDANTLLVGSPYNDGNGNNSGSVKVYAFDGTSWVQKGTTLYGESADNFAGYSVSMPDANTLAFGAYANAAIGYLSGQVKIFSWNGSAWVQKGGDLAGEASEDMFGWSVSMPDANTIAVGAKGNDGNGADSGHARVWSWNGTSWVQKGGDINGEAAGDNFGHSVSMPNSNKLAVSSIANQGNGTNAGHVRIFDWNGTAWVQSATDIDGEASGDQSGYSISMVNENFVAVSAPYNDADVPSSDRGHVRVYSLCTSTSNTIAPTACVSFTSPSGNYTWTQGGTYSDVITNAAGCDSIITINLTIGGVNTAVTNNDPQLVAAASGATYQWLDCQANFAEISNATSQTFNATANGSYAVEITIGTCTDTSDCQTISTLGLEDMENSETVIYPNPASAELYIQTTMEGEYSIFGLDGKVIDAGKVDNTTTVAIQDLKAGMYIIHVQNANGQRSVRHFFKE